MKRSPRMSGFTKAIVMLLSVTIASSCFLFLPSGIRSTLPQRGNYGYYSYLSGSASNPSSLASDELSPDQYIVQIPEIQKARTGTRQEAEAQELPEGTHIIFDRKGCSGPGSVGTLPPDTESALEIPFKIDTTQHYSVTVSAAADETVTNALRVNGERLTQFTLEGTGSFIRITVYGVFLEAGEAVIAIDTIDGGLDVDYIEIFNDNSVYGLEYDIPDTPCTPDASPETVKLYQFLQAQWGKHTLTGQYISGDNREIDLIYQMTGQFPAIRFSALGTADDRKQTEEAIDWNVYMHGIVGLMWYWEAPGSHSVYAKDTDFDLHLALRNQDPEQIASLTGEQAEQDAAEGKLSAEAVLLLKDIDTVAVSLQKFANMDIPVLWRPLYEAGGGWYWWGASGTDAYQQLWSLVYHRLTEYHQLHNLIWIWNGQSAAYLVPEDTYDIASADVYLQPNMEYGSRYEQFLSLARITNSRKLLALSECSALPDPEMMQLDSAVWSFFGLWCGEYIINDDGTFHDLYYSSNDLYNLYNSDQALTLNDFLSLYQ